MKKQLFFLAFLIFGITANAQKHPSTIADLQVFLGQSSTNFDKLMKSYGYPYHEKDHDEKNGQYLVQYYDGKEFEELELYIEGNTIDAVGFSFFTKEEGDKISQYVKGNDFKKICSDIIYNNSVGDEQEAWLSPSGKYKIKIISRNTFGSREVKKIMIAANSLNWGCEEPYKKQQIKPTTNNSSSTGSTTVNENKYDFSTASKFADQLNQWIRVANIGFGDGDKEYDFSVKGKTSFEKSSIEFFEKNDQLMLRMNIPSNGNCDYGLKEIKSKLSTQYGGGPDYFYAGFEYERKCNDKTYNNIFVYFRRETNNEKERELAVKAALKKYSSK